MCLVRILLDHIPYHSYSWGQDDSTRGRLCLMAHPIVNHQKAFSVLR